MRTILLAAVCAATLGGFGLSAAPVHAQGVNVAVIDINYIFKNHLRFKQAQEDMKKEVEAFENIVREQQKRIRTLQEKLQTFQPGSPDYKRQEEEIARIASEMQVQTSLKRKDFLDAEAKLYSNTYDEVVGVVARFCQRNNVGLVLRFNSEEIDATDRQSVLAGVNRAIVYQRNLNITDLILDDLNRVPPQAQRSGAPIVPPGGGRPATPPLQR